ncbi:hypothetical protein M0811_04146 [Anaeramoeba ignava]|uniref:Uncharacterized protein n=1 Tax=Anaeramoeba ignava TaxID=1746090 RepID=A0A9Q0LVI2_ANAIG|nr:hypothetical protein M0811_04146 [Anaeramoeba ignava]
MQAAYDLLRGNSSPITFKSNEPSFVSKTYSFQTQSSSSKKNKLDSLGHDFTLKKNTNEFGKYNSSVVIRSSVSQKTLREEFLNKNLNQN